MAAPTVRSVGTASTAGSSTPHAVPTPTIVSGDVLIAVLEYGTGTSTNHVTATGWTELSWRSQTAATGRTDLAVMGRIADGTEGASVNFAVAGTLNHVSGRMLSIQSHGCSVIGDVVVGSITGGAAGGADPQTNTVSGITVTADSLIMIIGGSARDIASTTEFNSWTNANLASITERMDNMNITGNGGGYGAATGTCAGTTTGSSTYEQLIREAWNGVQIGVKPTASGNATATPATVAGVATVPAPTVIGDAVPTGIQFSSGTDGITYTTGSVSFVNNTLPVAVIGISNNASDWVLTDSLGGTWTRLGFATIGTTLQCELWARDALANGSSSTLTFSHASGTAFSCHIQAYGVPGMTRTGAAALKSSQVGTDTNGASAIPAPVLPASATTTNPVVGGVISTGSGVPPSGWTELWDAQVESRSLETVWRASGFTGTTVTWGSTFAAFAALVAELDLSSSGTNATATPATVAAVASVPAPTVLATAVIAVATVAVLGTVPASQAQAAAKPTPATVAAVTSVPAPTVKGTAVTVPATVAGVATVPAPTVIATSPNATASPATVLATTSAPAPVVNGGAIATPATVAAPATVPVPSVQGTAKPTPAAVAATTTVPAPTIQGAAQLTPATVAAVATVPAPAVKGTAVTAPSTVAAVASVPPPTILAGGSVAVNVLTVQATTTVPAPTVTGTAVATPTRVAAVASVPTPTVIVGANALATPATVAVMASVGSPTVIATAPNATATPATVQAVASISAPTVTGTVGGRITMSQRGPKTGGIPTGAVLIVAHEGAQAGGSPAGAVLTLGREGAKAGGAPSGPVLVQERSGPKSGGAPSGSPLTVSRKGPVP